MQEGSAGRTPVKFEKCPPPLRFRSFVPQSVVSADDEEEFVVVVAVA
jgi:hypothetical protein